MQRDGRPVNRLSDKQSRSPRVLRQQNVRRIAIQRQTHATVRHDGPNRSISRLVSEVNGGTGGP
jgi:hypothetical protein